MEQHPQRARMARAAVCMLYTLTDGIGAPQRTATDILHHPHGATPTAGTDGTCCGLYAIGAHGWHRSTAATATDIEHHRHGATPTAGTDGARCGLYAIGAHGWHRSTAANRSAHISLSLRTYP